MARNKTEKTKPLSRKQEIRLQVATQLQSALPGLKEVLGEKEFEERVRKAAKLLAAGIKPSQGEKQKNKTKKKEKIVPGSNAA